ncbi:ZIP-like iron-zinc transporter [Mycena pura]|uniref:ZIP-like iron-zinc transporter n=1 Tax=Mycena pura TaxID=153505 RepID=A0AAD6YGN3_9AGAR|nr:ZIP-like iron-zinc transporter [Mycena pura]
MSDSDCSTDDSNTLFGLRVASVFVILVCSLAGALFPVLAKESSWLRVPESVFDFAKYFGSGVIIATAFIHLLSPALEELTSDCLSPEWQSYLVILSIMAIFIAELVAFRWGTAKLKRLGIYQDSHGHNVGSYVAHGPEGSPVTVTPPKEPKQVAERGDTESGSMDNMPTDADALAHILGIATLEFGILLHSVLIGLTLAVDPAFKTLFVVIVFHQMFEGLGVGSRLAYLQLPRRYRSVPVIGAILYGVSTPVGIAAGLGIRTTYNPNSAKASIVSGVLDSLSAGVLIYTGLVELLAHEFLFSRDMTERSNGHLAYAVICTLAGTGVMALMARWA